MEQLSPRARLLAAAEMLIAERGVEASLQDIAQAAGQRNKSAVHYHFGSRDELIATIVRERLQQLEARRMELLADAELNPGRDDVRALVAMLVLPLTELVERDGASHVNRFFERVRHHPSVADELNLWDETRPAVRIIVARIHRALAGLPPLTARYRLEAMATALLALVADHERTAGTHEGIDSPDGLIDVLTAIVTAPRSADSARS